MSCRTHLLYYRPEAPKVLTPDSLARFVREFAALGVSKPGYGISHQIQFGDSVDQDDRPTMWDDPASYSVQELDYDAEGRDFSDLDRMAEALAGLPIRPIHRTTMLLGSLVRPIYEALWRSWCEENDRQLGFNLGWSLEAGPIATYDPSVDPVRVGWLALALGGEGDPYPWTYRELIARAEAAPGFSMVLELCRRTWPVDPPARAGPGDRRGAPAHGRPLAVRRPASSAGLVLGPPGRLLKLPPRCPIMTLDDLLIHHRWWTYSPRSATWIEHATHGFNLFEGAAWTVFGVLVLARFLRNRRSWVELPYAIAFLTFGLTDFREASALDSWLIALKAINLVALFGLRRWVIRECYPESRLY